MKLRKRRKVFGVGINDADYNVCETARVDGKYKIISICPFYRTWKHVLERCYSEKYHLKNPTYRECTIYVEWLVFSNFKAWMETQEWEGKQLDKDLLKDGNKVYCPDYCIFVDQKLNKFVTDCNASRGEYMLGVSWDGEFGKFKAECRNPFTGKGENLGRFKTELEAHLAWKRRKHEHSCQLADSDLVADSRLIEALRTRYL